MFGTRMGCSFCGRRAANVAKLVAGPTRIFGRVYICDRCATQTIHIMEQHSDSDRLPEDKPSPLQRMVTRLLRTNRREDVPTDSQCHTLMVSGIVLLPASPRCGAKLAATRSMEVMPWTGCSGSKRRAEKCR